VIAGFTKGINDTKLFNQRYIPWKLEKQYWWHCFV